ncbi:ABC transporter permease [Halorubrum tebenquichense]|uniref:ABC transporter permease n=1 Tax=Halorubrum tebenquichense TaxID=119434 RepID=UPI0009E4D9DD
MPSTSVSRTECRRYLRGKTPWVIGVCFLLFSRITVQPESPELQILGEAAALVNVQIATTIVVPFAAAAIGFRAITRERESGTARLILGTKTTRSQFVLSIVLGRGVVFR